MNTATLDDIKTGAQPGLRFAALLDRKGGCRDLDWDGIRQWKPEDGFLWIHLERDDETAATWLRRESGVDPLVALALLADESRPRVEDVDDNLLVVLRGVNVDEASGHPELVPIHIWGEANRLISLREKDHQLSALRNIRLALLTGKGPRSPGGLLAQIAERVVEHLEIILENLEEEIGILEDQAIERTADPGMRGKLARARRSTIQLRRYLGPQRDALYRIQHDDSSWLSRDARLRLREVTDKVVRHIEDLDALRERATVLHEDLSAQISERIAQNSNRFTALTALLLPPSLVAGLLGANIGGIPGTGDPNAFWELLVIIAVMMPGLWLVLRRINWL
ncbi:Magnesium and cobalt transporter protein [Magnetospirillum gryphiswaldense MSR-1 v2]|uniref:Magnesium and cobalt transporter protein n=1 Tax=Magnetospirillum gryphiswaldense (strain DSM 6361 / JCM 21280 / NBRC 15271 / MSR-1) TaxID=431944 RepID=V6EYL4_MAGGM|nr:zinc transporter ZntB [Magnetospirillum gryphiswaldense]CDK98274.1 Magnesium and cobalt transporter protein [Magnetospirillum gryphiswaldense MSR-1 v2]